MDIKEYIIPFEGNTFYQGRIVVYGTKSGFNADVLITNIESGKIYQSVKQIYNVANLDDLVQTGVQCLADYLLKSNEESLLKSSKDTIV